MMKKLTTNVLALSLAVPLAAAAAPDYVLPTSAEETHPLQAGGPMPDATVREIDGTAVSLRSLAEGKPTVLIFYRGGWCPFCNAHLAALQGTHEELVGLGYQVLAIGADSPEGLRPTLEKHRITYTLLADSDMSASAAFGLAFRLSDDILKKYDGYGIKLTAVHDGQFWLPVPAVYIVRADGRIAYVHADPDYRVRLPMPELLAAAHRALEKDPTTP
jgi:peroxiredoxin